MDNVVEVSEPVVGIGTLEKLPVWIWLEQKHGTFIWGTRRKHKDPAFKAYYVCGTLFTAVTADGKVPVPPPALDDWELVGWFNVLGEVKKHSYWMRTAKKDEHYYII